MNRPTLHNRFELTFTPGQKPATAGPMLIRLMAHSAERSYYGLVFYSLQPDIQYIRYIRPGIRPEYVRVIVWFFCVGGGVTEKQRRPPS